MCARLTLTRDRDGVGVHAVAHAHECTHTNTLICSHTVAIARRVMAPTPWPDAVGPHCEDMHVDGCRLAAPTQPLESEGYPASQR
jgi:hypothetical protein